MKYLLILSLAASCAACGLYQGKSQRNSPPPPPMFTKQQKAEINAEAAKIEQQIRTEEGDYDAYIKLGRLYTALNKPDDVQRVCEKAEQLAPERPDAYFCLGIVYEKKHLNDKAASSWEKCLEHSDREETKEIAKKHIQRLNSL